MPDHYSHRPAAGGVSLLEQHLERVLTRAGVPGTGRSGRGRAGASSAVSRCYFGRSSRGVVLVEPGGHARTVAAEQPEQAERARAASEGSAPAPVSTQALSAVTPSGQDAAPSPGLAPELDLAPELEPGLGLDEASAVVLGQIEALEAQRARLDARLLAAYAALHTVARQQVEALPGPVEGASAAERDAWCRQAVIAEIAEATAVPAGQVASRLTVAAEPGRYQPLLARLRDGQVSLAHTLQVATDTAQLDPGLLEPITARVFAPMRDGSRPNHATVTRRLRRAVISAAGVGR